MNKKLTLADYLLTLLILFILVGALGAFFYGVKVGKDKTTDKYERLIAEKTEMAKDLTAYHQQYLVSFYHTIYLPYRDFQKKWFERIETLDLHSGSIDAKDVFKELGKLADEKLVEIKSMAMPVSSPLLQEAHENYLKSLKLFAESADRFRSRIGTMNGEELNAALRKDAYFTEAQKFGLSAQSSYYTSIVRWNESVQLNLNGKELSQQDDLSIQEWGQLNFNLKNQFVSFLMESNHYYKGYYPQDLTIRIDELLLEGQADRMKISSIRPIIEMLVETDAVRSGDYLKRKQKFYRNETLPQLPFFFE